MSGTLEPAAPGAAAPAVITLSAADLAQLLAAAGKRVEADVLADASPSKLVAAVKAIPSELGKVNWPMVVVALVAFAALALHFPKVLPFTL